MDRRQQRRRKYRRLLAQRARGKTADRLRLQFLRRAAQRRRNIDLGTDRLPELEAIEATADPLHLRPYSAFIDLPALSTIWLEVPQAEESVEDGAGDELKL